MGIASQLGSAARRRTPGHSRGRRAGRHLLFAVLAGALCLATIGTTRAFAEGPKEGEHCRTAADDAELAKLEKELDSLKIHKALLEELKAGREKSLRNRPFAGKDEVNQKTKDLEDLDAALKENAARTQEVEARIAVLKALKPCPPETKTPPPPPPPVAPGGVTLPPVPAHPCRTPEDDKTIVALKAKKALYERELKVLKRWIDTLGSRYSEQKQSAKTAKDKAELEATDKQLTEYERQRVVLEGEIADLAARIKELEALKPCVEEPKAQTPPVAPGPTPVPKKPKKPVKHGKKDVSEDSPLYMQNYTPPAKTTTRQRSGSGDYSNAPPEEPKGETNDKPPGDTQPEIPVPH